MIVLEILEALEIDVNSWIKDSYFNIIILEGFSSLNICL